MSFDPHFTVTNKMTADLTRIERARGFLEAATLSEDWIRQMGAGALILEAHHTTHIEGTKLSLDESERLLAGEAVPGADPEDVRELLNYRDAFDFVSAWLGSGGPITEGLVREIRGERTIRQDVLVREHALSDRQAAAVGHVIEHGRLTIQDFTELCPETNLRTLQRDLKALVDKGLLVGGGTAPTDPTRHYRPAPGLM